jgi:hypothetical protein
MIAVQKKRHHRSVDRYLFSLFVQEPLEYER